MNPETTDGRPTPFEVEQSEMDGGVRVFSIRGELDLGTAPTLEQSLSDALDGAGGAILVDLSECEFIDSTGIALIVRAWQRTQNGDSGGMAICCANRQVERVLEISGVGASIPLYDDVDAALAAI